MDVKENRNINNGFGAIGNRTITIYTCTRRSQPMALRTNPYFVPNYNGLREYMSRAKDDQQVQQVNTSVSIRTSREQDHAEAESPRAHPIPEESELLNPTPAAGPPDAPRKDDNTPELGPPHHGSQTSLSVVEEDIKSKHSYRPAQGADYLKKPERNSGGGGTRRENREAFMGFAEHMQAFHGAESKDDTPSVVRLGREPDSIIYGEDGMKVLEGYLAKYTTLNDA
ncbi:MAG: hypothetical protein Q9226_002310 [Calogaya cf. arnoldii]